MNTSLNVKNRGKILKSQDGTDFRARTVIRAFLGFYQTVHKPVTCKTMFVAVLGPPQVRNAFPSVSYIFTCVPPGRNRAELPDLC